MSPWFLLAVNVVLFAVNAYFLITDPYGLFRWLSVVALMICAAGITFNVCALIFQQRDKP